MVGRMTSWTLNLMLAGMAVSAVFLPAPDEIRRAIEYGQQSDRFRVELVDAPQPKSLVEVSAPDQVSTVSVRIEQQAAVACLSNFQTMPREGVERCTEQLSRVVRSYDVQAKRRVHHGERVYANPKIEEIRMALTNLCRVHWAENRTTDSRITWDSCQAVTVGIAY